MKKAVKPYNTEDSKKVQIEKMFNEISHNYDLLNRVLSMRVDNLWRKKLVKKCQPIEKSKILDIATGTGDLAITFHKKGAKNVTGLDLSQNMIEVAKKKNSHIKFVKGDSENLTYDENTFDIISVAFGVRNFEDLYKGLLEINRVLNIGGKLAILEFGLPTNIFFKLIYNFYFKLILPFFGKLISRSKTAYTYLPESVNSFPYGTEFADILKKNNFKNIQAIPLTFGICYLYIAEK